MSWNNNILLIDADHSFARKMAIFFEQSNFNAHIANSVEETAAFIKVIKPELIVTEYKTPTCSGSDLVKRLRRFPQAASVPIIFLSQADDLKYRVRGLEAGAMDFIHKSVLPQEIILRVRQAIRLTRLLRTGTMISGQTSQALTGDLTSFPIFDVLQIIGQQNRKGTLHVRLDHREGWISVNSDGTVNHASLDSQVEHEAFNRIIALKTGTFHFYPDEQHKAPNMSEPIMCCIMEGARQIDELERYLQVLEPTSQRVSLTGFDGEEAEALEPVRSLIEEDLSIQEIIDHGEGGRLDTAHRLYLGVKSGALAPESSLWSSGVFFTTEVVLKIDELFSGRDWSPESVSEVILKADPSLGDSGTVPSERALNAVFQTVTFIKNKYSRIGDAAVADIVQLFRPEVRIPIIARFIMEIGCNELTMIMMDRTSNEELERIKEFLAVSR